mgnify:CR=1 FL=1
MVRRYSDPLREIERQLDEIEAMADRLMARGPALTVRARCETARDAAGQLAGSAERSRLMRERAERGRDAIAAEYRRAAERLEWYEEGII